MVSRAEALEHARHLLGPSGGVTADAEVYYAGVRDLHGVRVYGSGPSWEAALLLAQARAQRMRGPA